MRIAIFGLGYVGAVSAACFSAQGHRVIGVDKADIKVDLIMRGNSPVVERGVGEMMAAGRKDGTLSATVDAASAVKESDAALVCVGTPSLANGDLDLGYLTKVCEEIGASLAERDGFYVVIIRSTVLAGTLRGLVIPTLEQHSGKRAGQDFGVAFHPEFLREGTAVHDFYNPPKIVVAATDPQSAKLAADLNEGLDAPLVEAEFEVAEMVKYADNAWHAVKVSFANEVGTIAKAHGVDGGKVMDIFCQDRKLNLSEKYLRPGFAFGGSCLPKDVRALTYRARTKDLNLPLLNSIMPSNQSHVERALNMIMEQDTRRVGVLGISFKAGTDDLRESPVVELVERLLGKGYDIRVFDRNVNLSRLVGANKAQIMQRLPHVANLMAESLWDVVDFSDTLVVGNNDESLSEAIGSMNSAKTVIDLVRLPGLDLGARYHGICW